MRATQVGIEVPIAVRAPVRATQVGIEVPIAVRAPVRATQVGIEVPFTVLVPVHATQVGIEVPFTVLVPVHATQVGIEVPIKGIRMRQTGIDLSQETLTLAVCVRIERRDGQVVCLTTHDAELLVDGEAYEPMGGVDATAVRQEAGAGVDNLDVAGLIQSERISESDLLAGRYDGATVRLFVVDWQQPDLAPLRLLKGQFGNITVQAGRYTAEIRSLSQRLGQQIGDLVSPTCRVKALGDMQCGVNLAAYRATRVVVSVKNRSDITFGGDWNPSGWYSYGRIQMMSGANSGIAREVRAHTQAGGQARLQLQEALPFDVAAGDTAVLEAGCDRRLETCRDKFGNAVNFRGEPHVPGTETLLQRGRE